MMPDDFVWLTTPLTELLAPVTQLFIITCDVHKHGRLSTCNFQRQFAYMNSMNWTPVCWPPGDSQNNDFCLLLCLASDYWSNGLD